MSETEFRIIWDASRIRPVRLPPNRWHPVARHRWFAERRAELLGKRNRKVAG